MTRKQYKKRYSVAFRRRMELARPRNYGRALHRYHKKMGNELQREKMRPLPAGNYQVMFDAIYHVRGKIYGMNYKTIHLHTGTQIHQYIERLNML